LTFRRGIQLYARNFESCGAFESGFNKPLRKTRTPVIRPAEHHSNPRQSASVAQQCRRYDAIIDLHGETTLRIEPHQHLPIIDGLFPPGQTRNLRGAGQVGRVQQARLPRSNQLSASSSALQEIRKAMLPWLQ
jgi:hypothetical protein